MSQYDYDIEDVLKHFSGEDSEDMLKFMNEVVFKDSRYIFTTRENRQQYGYCTYCGEKYETDGMRHHEEECCPECDSLCTVKASGYGRSYMIDERYFVWYEKSVINRDAIVARGIYAVRDWRGEDYWNVETQFRNAGLYVFELGGAMAIRRSVGYPHWHDNSSVFWTSSWERCRKIYSEGNNGHTANIDQFYSRKSIEEAVKDTPFQYSCWEDYTDVNGDMIDFFGYYSKWPCIEYLTKLGFKNLVQEKIDGGKTYNAINWRGKTLTNVLKINKDDLKEIQENNIELTFLILKIFQNGKKDGSNLSISEAQKIKSRYGYYYSDLERLLKYGNFRKIDNYIQKQFKKDQKHLYSFTGTLTTWRDYIADCKKLEMDLEDEKVLFPRNLYQAHQNTIKQIEIRENKKLREKFLKRYKELKKYSFDYKNLLIRPAKTEIELIEEGKVLSHCVGTYGKRHAKGDTGIFFIRKKTAPDESYYTVEIRDDQVAQVRGKNNVAPNEEVSEFVEIFKNEKLGKKKHKKSA